MSTRTGSDALYGVRYDALSNKRPSHCVVADADLGALDAPDLIASGSHVSSSFLGPCTRAAFRRTGNAMAVPLTALEH